MKTRRFPIAFGAILALAAAGCGNKAGAPEQSSAQPAPSVNAATAGSITGTVTLDGAPPAARAINMDTDPNCQKDHPSPVMWPQVVLGDRGALANAVVYVKSGAGKFSYPAPKAPAVLSQQGCMYDPHIVALMAGQPLEVKNNDQTTHNVHAMPSDNSGWNKSQPPGAGPIEETFDHPELAIPVQCNIHPWMKSYLFVFANPYYAVTPKTGKFELKDLPPGAYTIEAWHEKYGTADANVTVGPKESKSVSFTFKASSSGN